MIDNIGKVGQNTLHLYVLMLSGKKLNLKLQQFFYLIRFSFGNEHLHAKKSSYLKNPSHFD